MRLILVALVLAAGAPSSARAQTSAALSVGYDRGVGAPTAAVAVEAAIPVPGPVALGVGYEHVFVVDLTSGAPDYGRGRAFLVGRFGAFGAFGAFGGNFTPYGRAGFDVGWRFADDGSGTDIDGTIGLGVETSHVFVEGTVGVTGPIDQGRVAVGNRF